MENSDKDKEAPDEVLELPVKRGRKRHDDMQFRMDEFLLANTVVSFLPSRMTREQIAYCMRETGMFNKSAIISLAITNYHAMLQAEAMRRAKLESFDTIAADNFRPKKK